MRVLAGLLTLEAMEEAVETLPLQEELLPQRAVEVQVLVAEAV